MPKNEEPRRRKKRDRQLVGARCRLCSNPFIYATVGRLQLTSCPVCASEQISSGCLTASLRLALALGELEALTERARQGETARLPDQLQELVVGLSTLRDDLALIPPKC